MHKLKKLFCAFISAFQAFVSVDEYMTIIYGYWDEDCPDEHETCWQ